MNLIISCALHSGFASFAESPDANEDLNGKRGKLDFPGFFFFFIGEQFYGSKRFQSILCSQNCVFIWFWD